MFTHVTHDDRISLAQLLWAGKSQEKAAERLGKDAGTISRELKRNTDRDGIYRGAHADRQAHDRRKSAKKKCRKIENDRKLRRHIVRKLKLRWSPEQIAGRLKIMTGRTVVCHETIYSFLYEKRPDLTKYLRCTKGKYRRKRGTKAKEVARDKAKVRSIDDRPKHIDDRTEIGHWEGDTVIGGEKTQRILTHVERMSGYLAADKLSVVSAEIVQKTTVDRFKNLPRSTITYDNGSEFGEDDATLEKKLGIEVYRAHPYHSWERGTNENTNGLLRQFFPKKSFFATITQNELDRVVRLLNNRPRKRLGYLTPREVLRKELVAFQIRI